MTEISKWTIVRPICLILLLAVSACTNSRLVISPLYNQLDDRIRKEFHKLGDFNDEQIAAFEQRLGTYHVWHRQAELPLYGKLLNEIASSIKQGSSTASDVKRWFEQVELHSRAARECHPINFSFELIQSLTDEQLNYIERRFKNQQKKNQQRYASKSRTERLQRRLSNMEKWAGRINLDFTDEQREILRTTFQQQQSLRAEYYELTADWNRQFFKIARNQQLANYSELLGAHIDKLWSLLETAHSEQWNENRELWQAASYKFIQSMTSQQRTQSSRWLFGLSNTLDTISRYEPSFKPDNGEYIGCPLPADAPQTPG
ncbi:MAG: hypothetical protein KTR32_23600 [Granulosicoccus sp.]|nr:hypothetical protein [Granulosicoccus sp.]